MSAPAPRSCPPDLPLKWLVKTTVAYDAEGLPHTTADRVAAEVEGWRTHAGLGFSIVAVRQYKDFDANQPKFGRLDVYFLWDGPDGAARMTKCGTLTWKDGAAPLAAKAAWEQARKAYLATRAGAKANPDAAQQTRAALRTAREAYESAAGRLDAKLARLVTAAANGATRPNATATGGSVQKSAFLAGWSLAYERRRAVESEQAQAERRPTLADPRQLGLELSEAELVVIKRAGQPAEVGYEQD